MLGVSWCRPVFGLHVLSFFRAEDGADLPVRRRAALLQLAQVDRVQFPIGMTLSHVSTRVRDMLGAGDAIRAFESRLLAALEFLMVGQTALAAEDAGTIRAGVLLIRHPRARIHVDRLRSCRFRRHRRRRLKNVASRSRGEHIVIQA